MEDKKDVVKKDEKKEEKKEEKKLPFKWPPLESDPTILTEFMQKLGMPKSWELSEVLGLEPDFLAIVPKTSVAFVLAYDYKGGSEEASKEKKIVPEVDYYMLQCGNLDNACGLIACIHAVFNNLSHIKLLPGSPLDKFWTQSCKLNPKERADTLDGCEEIQAAHDKCGHEGQSEFVEEADETKYHFICFTRNKAQQLVELDGIIGTPITLKGSK